MRAMKKICAFMILGVLATACSKGGMSADVGDGGYGVETTVTIPDFDFTNSLPDTDLEIEYPTATTTTTTTITTSTITTTTTTLPVSVTSTTLITDGTVTDTTTTTTTTIPVVTTTTLKEVEVVTEVEPEFEPSLLVKGATKEDFVGYAELSPTIYYISTLSENSGTYACAEDQKVSMLGPDEQELVKVCPKTYAVCLMEGSCIVAQGDRKIPINYNQRSKKSGKLLFMLFDVNKCPYGLGSKKGLCLDPYYSVAADLSIYKEGTVIFVPKLVGLDMGNGSRHHGFFVVRDMGHLIKGRGRFDFFTGYQNDRDAKNLFKPFKMADKNTRIKYYLVDSASKLNHYIKGVRNYPSVPSVQKPKP